MNVGNLENKVENKDLFNHANKLICNFLTQKFIYKYATEQENKKVSLRKYEDKSGIVHTTLQKLVSENGYNIPMAVLVVILHYENVPLSVFFKEFEQYCKTKYPLDELLSK